MQNRMQLIDKLNQHVVSNCVSITMIIYHIVELAYLYLAFAVLVDVCTVQKPKELHKPL